MGKVVGGAICIQHHSDAFDSMPTWVHSGLLLGFLIAESSLISLDCMLHHGFLLFCQTVLNACMPQGAWCELNVYSALNTIAIPDFVEGSYVSGLTLGLHLCVSLF